LILVRDLSSTGAELLLKQPVSKQILIDITNKFISNLEEKNASFGIELLNNHGYFSISFMPFWS
jgi:hypothetical protein